MNQKQEGKKAAREVRVWKVFEANWSAWYVHRLLMTNVGQSDCLSVNESMQKESFMVIAHVSFTQQFWKEGSPKSVILIYRVILKRAYSSLYLKTHTFQHAGVPEEKVQYVQ